MRITRLGIVVLALLVIACGTSRAIPTVAPNANIVVPSYEVIASKAHDMTDAQWKQYSAGLVGGIFRDWTGWIVDVEEKRDGSYLVKIALDPPETAWRTYKVEFNLSKDEAISLNKNQKVLFGGTIVSVENPLGECYIKASGAVIRPAP